MTRVDIKVVPPKKPKQPIQYNFHRLFNPFENRGGGKSTRSYLIHLLTHEPTILYSARRFRISNMPSPLKWLSRLLFGGFHHSIPLGHTGWSNWTEISFDLITLARRHPMKWDRSLFSPDIRTFRYIISKHSNRFYIIFTDWCVGGHVF